MTPNEHVLLQPNVSAASYKLAARWAAILQETLPPQWRFYVETIALFDRLGLQATIIARQGGEEHAVRDVILEDALSESAVDMDFMLRHYSERMLAAMIRHLYLEYKRIEKGEG